MHRLKICSVVLIRTLKPTCSSAMIFSASGFNLFSKIFSMTLLGWLMRLIVRYHERCEVWQLSYPLKGTWFSTLYICKWFCRSCHLYSVNNAISLRVRACVCVCVCVCVHVILNSSGLWSQLYCNSNFAIHFKLFCKKLFHIYLVLQRCQHHSGFLWHDLTA